MEVDGPIQFHLERHYKRVSQSQTNCFQLTVTAGSKNSEIVYSIVDGNLQSNFSIDPSTGEIQVAHPLDFELVAPTPL